MATQKPKTDGDTGDGDGDSASAVAPPADGAPDGAPAGDGDDDAGGNDTPAGTVPGAPSAAPLEAPAPRRMPAPTPTRTVEPNAALREAPGDGHVALVDHDGNPLGEDDLFYDEGAHLTWLRTKQRVYQQFRYPHTDTVTTQLLFPAGAKVPRDRAERVKITLRKAAAEPEAAG